MIWVPSSFARGQDSYTFYPTQWPVEERVGGAFNSKLLVHPELQSVIADLKRAKIQLPTTPTAVETNVERVGDPWDVSSLDSLDPKDQGLRSGLPIDPERPLPSPIAAYDESIRRFSAVEGTAYLTCHSLVILGSEDYVPVMLVTLRFYSRAKSLSESHAHIRYSDNIGVQVEKDYMHDRIQFLLDNTPNNALLLVDGPLIAGDAYTTMIQSLEHFHDKGISPVFVVKNSESDIVIRNSLSLKGNFNSDLHWANEILRPGEASRLFRYSDSHNPDNTKVFFYIRPFNRSPQRVEIQTHTYSKFKERLQFISSNLYYYYIAQGDVANLQVRPIAVAESFAREGLRVLDLEATLDVSQITPIMNHDRFGG